jgi:hypothetical protein
MNILESYILSEKTLSVDFDDWVNGKRGPLLIPGYMGAGKSIAGKYLSNEYGRELIALDNISPKQAENKLPGEYRKKVTIFHKQVISMLKDPKNMNKIIEGLPLLDMYNEDFYRDLDENELKNIRQTMLNCPMILLGTSVMKSVMNAANRSLHIKPGKVFKSIRFSYRVNTDYNKWVQQLRKDRLNVDDAVIKRFEIPKFKVIYAKNKGQI